MTEPLPGRFVVVRHAESEWNALGKWTGRTDVSLTPKGFEEAAKLGTVFGRLAIHVGLAYCSEQVRTRETLQGMLAQAGQETSILPSSALNERDYGEYTGKNKWEMKDLLGAERFAAVRRGWDVAIPGGETLKMVYERAVPFYRETIVPQLAAGKNVLMVSHGNTIRALKKYIESVSDESIADMEMPFGELLIYDVDPEGRKLRSESVKIDTAAPNA